MLEQTTNDSAPLAHRMRPGQLKDVIGQEHIWAEKKPLYEMVVSDQFRALLFWGPPGTGKTSLARLIGTTVGRDVIFLSAVNATVKDLRQVMQHPRTPVLFLDEIHRLSRTQQDVLLPALEDGTIKFIGATTENPSFTVTHAILSRCLVFRFERLSHVALVKIIENALQKSRRTLSKEVETALAAAGDGDARRTLNLLEAVLATSSGEATLADLEELGIQKTLLYDRAGDQHYDTISAFIKSIRASHPDAAVHYLARMLQAGEDPVFIARRLILAASEDIGNANPTALLVAVAGMQAIQAIGLPEGRIVLSQVTTYLASSPKSNRSYLAINRATSDLEDHGSLPIPLHLRNATTNLSKHFGYGKFYISPHDDASAAQKLTYLPDSLAGRNYYEPSDIGAEKQLKEILKTLKPKGPSGYG